MLNKVGQVALWQLKSFLRKQAWTFIQTPNQNSNQADTWKAETQVFNTQMLEKK